MSSGVATCAHQQGSVPAPERSCVAHRPPQPVLAGAHPLYHKVGGKRLTYSHRGEGLVLGQGGSTPSRRGPRPTLRVTVRRYAGRAAPLLLPAHTVGAIVHRPVLAISTPGGGRSSQDPWYILLKKHVCI